MPTAFDRLAEEARRALWLPPGDAAIFGRMRRLGELARPPRGPHGVFRFRSIAEAKASKHPWAR